MPADALVLVAMILLTASAYAAARSLYMKYRHPLVQPVFLGGGLVIAVLALSGRTFEEYLPARDVLGWLLGPVTVALAVPVYNQRAHLRRAALPLACGVALGGCVTIAAALALAALGHVQAAVLPA